VVVEGPPIAYSVLDVVTRRTDPIPATGFGRPSSDAAAMVYGADFTYPAMPGRAVGGVIRDAKTNQPQAGVTVKNKHATSMWGYHDLKTETDSLGRFRLDGLPRGRGSEIIAIPNDDQPYFMQELVVPDPPRIGPNPLLRPGSRPVEVRLHKGIWIEGRVTERTTGRPVPKAWLHYLPFLDNTFAQATPEFDSDGNMRAGGDVQDRYQTGADGTFRLVGLPGRAIVGVDVWDQPFQRGAGSERIDGLNQKGWFPTYRNPVNAGKLWPTAMKEINPAEGTMVVHVDFELDAGAAVRLRAVDRQGRPVAGAKVSGRTRRGQFARDAQAEAEFEVVALGPDEDRIVLICHEERKLGKVVHVRQGDDMKGKVSVLLEPLAMIVGRVVDAESNPVAGAVIVTDPLPSGSYSLTLGQVAADKQGRFVVPNVPAGCDYRLTAERGFTGERVHFASRERVSVRTGETTDVGEVRFQGE
jgi:hypothetical protein